VTREERARFCERAPLCVRHRVAQAAHRAICEWSCQCHPDHLIVVVDAAIEVEAIATPGWERLIGRPAEAA
jgi:hypothetical protein